MPPRRAGKDSEPGLASLIADIEKAHGKGALMRLGDTPMEPIDTFSTGSIRLDEALGIGGLPFGRIVEVYGPESSGKTSLALHATGNAQRQGRRAAFIDAEHAFDPAWADRLGVDTDGLYINQPDSGEEGLQVAAKVVGSGEFGVVTIDSVAALVPEAELKGEIGDSHIGLQARMMSQGLRMITGAASSTGTTVIFINQLREKVGVFFGNPETTTGGKALKFYASIRLDVRRVETLRSGGTSGEAIGSRVRVKVVKNKLSPPFRQAEFDFHFTEGISHGAELLDLAVERGVVRKSGAHYRFPGHEGTENGKEKARAWLAEHPDEAAALEAAVRSATPLPVPSASRGRDGSAFAMEGEAPWDKIDEAEEAGAVQQAAERTEPSE